MILLIPVFGLDKNVETEGDLIYSGKISDPQNPHSSIEGTGNSRMEDNQMFCKR
ncbi:hypothetical protein [Aerococcus christensenii]|uniref:hypothetical protein n=1 Tax=Aerococcus christensenii TaxID=87541 RepID=UPI0023AA17ED|nr:hypothetical protein [Aerococcus christensenii]WEB70603.1 hypothetical protein PUW42_05920 [Aerococcus christensenii]